MKDFVLILPELVLALTVLGLIMAEVGYTGERIRLLSLTALLGLGGALIQTILCYKLGPTQAFGRTLTIDPLALFFQCFAILLGILTVIAAGPSREIPNDKRPEYYALVVGFTLSICLVSAASNLILCFLSLQLMNLLGYFLSGFGKRSVRSSEAAVKYLVFGSVTGALFLYGAALLFLSAHSLNLYEIHRALIVEPLAAPAAWVIFLLLFLSVGAQLYAFPMHLVAPDVMEGAPTASSAMLSVGPRAAGLALFIRLLFVVFCKPGGTPGQWEMLGVVDWTPLLSLLAGLTLGVGGLLAYQQSGAKRLISYLVVAETGFLLLGLLVRDETGVAATLYGLVVDLFALVGSYFVISRFQDRVGSDRLADLGRALEGSLPEGILLVLLLCSLAGIPPLPGAVSRFALISAAVQHGHFALGCVAIGSLALSGLAVMRLAFALLGNVVENRARLSESVAAVQQIRLGIYILPIILVGVFSQWVLTWANHSFRLILW